MAQAMNGLATVVKSLRDCRGIDLAAIEIGMLLIQRCRNELQTQRARIRESLERASRVSRKMPLYMRSGALKIKILKIILGAIAGAIVAGALTFAIAFSLIPVGRAGGMGGVDYALDSVLPAAIGTIVGIFAGGGLVYWRTRGGSSQPPPEH